MSGFIGKYRNHRGVEMEITGVNIDPNILGTTYKGVIRDELFGAHHVLVTPAGLIECGYVKADEDEDER